jgi:hypothetical protein
MNRDRKKEEEHEDHHHPACPPTKEQNLKTFTTGPTHNYDTTARTKHSTDHSS